MKKCATIIFYSALFLLFSCAGGKKGEDPPGEKKNRIDTIKIHEEYSFAYVKENAPTLTLDINLPYIHLDDKNATARLDSALALELFNESLTLRESCMSFMSMQKKEFDELRDDFHNYKEGELPLGMMQLYCEIIGNVSWGYK
ncbi:MAG: hypothetical protein J6U89_00135, partial [Bacteroidaceae bacterium]|nr:hypothetical protein [Bacteroidaceae bacterium]